MHKQNVWTPRSTIGVIINDAKVLGLLLEVELFLVPFASIWLLLIQLSMSYSRNVRFESFILLKTIREAYNVFLQITHVHKTSSNSRICSGDSYALLYLGHYHWKFYYFSAWKLSKGYKKYYKKSADFLRGFSPVHPCKKVNTIFSALRWYRLG